MNYQKTPEKRDLCHMHSSPGAYTKAAKASPKCCVNYNPLCSEMSIQVCSAVIIW